MSDKHYDHPMAHHDPKEGYDPTEPAAPKITFFVIGSVVLLVITIVALQRYFDTVWYGAVEERVLAAPTVDLQSQRNLEAWRLSHYEFTTPSKTLVRMPVAKAREMFLKESAEGKTFYPGKSTVPKPEEIPGVTPAVAGAAGKQEGKQPEGKQEAKQQAKQENKK